MASYVLAGTIEVSPDLLGIIRVDRANRYTPDDRKELLGYRPSLPLLVNSMNVKTVADIAAANVDEEGHFIISPIFIGGPGDTLYDQGAKPGSIGTKTIRGVTTIYVFRTPYEHEVVWHVVVEDDGDIHELGFHRWDGETWQPYKTWPERALEGMRAFEVLDPDKIWEYYARVIGATQTQWTVDARALLDFLDPDRCPIELLPELAGNFGLVLDATEQGEVQRQKVKDAIPTYKLKGLPLAVELRLRSLGYTGYSREIWVNPENPNNWIDDNTGEKGNDWIEVIHGSRHRAPRIGLLFVGAEQPSDGEIVTIDDYTTSVTFEFEISGGVSGGNTAVAVGADAYETLENLIAAVNASALTVEASKTPLAEWPEMSLDGGKIESDSIIIKTFNYYFPSSRVSIHINRLAGQPLSMTSPASALEEFEQFIATQLGEDVLPAPIDIRFFATDLEVGPPGSERSDKLEVADSLVLGEYVVSGTDYQPTATGNPTGAHSWDKSSVFSGSFPAWHPADDLNNTWWLSASGPPQWWAYIPDVDVRFVKASLRAPTSGGAEMPKDFTIEGYNGTSWIILKTITGETGWSASEVRYFEWSNSVAYQKYRINVSANNGGSYVALAEVEWFALVPAP